MRRARETAQRRGIPMKGLLAELVKNGLYDEPNPVRQTGMHKPIPVLIPAAGRKLVSLTNSEIFDILDREDDEAHGRLP